MRRPLQEDMRQWIELRRKSETFLKPWEPQWPDDDLSKTGYLRRLRSYNRQIEVGTAKIYFLFGHNGRTLLGGLSLTRIDQKDEKSAMLGYWMGEPYAGKGLMGHAVSALLSNAFSNLGLDRVHAACLPGNERSVKLLQRQGFVQLGLRPDFLEINGKKEDHLLFRVMKDG